MNVGRSEVKGLKINNQLKCVTRSTIFKHYAEESREEKIKNHHG